MDVYKLATSNDAKMAPFGTIKLEFFYKKYDVSLIYDLVFIAYSLSTLSRKMEMLIALSDRSTGRVYQRLMNFREEI